MSKKESPRNILKNMYKIFVNLEIIEINHFDSYNGYV